MLCNETAAERSVTRACRLSESFNFTRPQRRRAGRSGIERCSECTPLSVHGVHDCLHCVHMPRVFTILTSIAVNSFISVVVKTYTCNAKIIIVMIHYPVDDQPPSTRYYRCLFYCGDNYTGAIAHNTHEHTPQTVHVYC